MESVLNPIASDQCARGTPAVKKHFSQSCMAFCMGYINGMEKIKGERQAVRDLFKRAAFISFHVIVCRCVVHGMACLAGGVLAQQGEEALEGAQHGAVDHHGRRRHAALVCRDDAMGMLGMLAGTHGEEQ
jgi:hypothetical protein